MRAACGGGAARGLRRGERGERGAKKDPLARVFFVFYIALAGRTIAGNARYAPGAPVNLRVGDNCVAGLFVPHEPYVDISDKGSLLDDEKVVVTSIDNLMYRICRGVCVTDACRRR